MDLRDKRILVTGGAGFLGRHVVAELKRQAVPEENISVPRSTACDLRRMEDCQAAVRDVDVLVHLAASVGGIGANRAHPGRFFYDNAIMGVQLMEAARQAGVQKFVTIGTVCAYPKFPALPFREEELWSGYPEETNAPYGLAKRMLLVQGQTYRQEYGFNVIYLLPANLYGPGDNFDPDSSHVIPALMRKVDEAMEQKRASIEAWGTGTPTREFLYVEDAAEGIVKAASLYDKPEPVNLGSGVEISIRDLVHTIADLMGFAGEIVWDASKPDGQPRRRLDVSKAKSEFGFAATTPFEEGLRRTIAWFKETKRRTGEV